MNHSAQIHVRAARKKAIGFLERAQLPNGAFRAFTSFLVDMSDDGKSDPSVFPTALIVQSLGSINGTEAMCKRALGYLVRERTHGGLWRHWPQDHPEFRMLPADVDDSCCVSSVLITHGRTDVTDAALLLANRDSAGRFLTWFIPRWRWRGVQHARATWPLLVHPIILTFFFRKTSAAPSDVDAGVNANALFYLGSYPGHEAVVEYLLDILKIGAENDADKWYDNPFVLWHLIARALIPLSAEAAPLLLTRLNTAKPTSALDQALAISIRYRCGVSATDTEISGLLAQQFSDGSWRRASFYFGGRERRRDGTLASAHPDTPRWGSEELTTGHVIEALTYWLEGSEVECKR